MMTDPNKAPTEIEALVAEARGLSPHLRNVQARDLLFRLADALQSATAGRGAEHVDFYEREFYPLSNFSAFTLKWPLERPRQLRFDTSEAAYHWEKFVADDPGVADMIREAPSAHEAFKLAEKYKSVRRPDWDEVKVPIMRRILRAKLDQHEYVRRKLMETGDRELIECSWRDDFWGWGPNHDGQNMLGKLWMEIRSELRTSPPRQEQSASEPGVSDFPTPIEICRAYGVSGAAAAQLALILNPDGKTTLGRLTSGPAETTLIHAKQDGRIERLRPSAEGAAAGDCPITDRVAEPAGARYPGEHGESKGGHGDDPMLSGSHGPHHTPVAQSVEPAGRTTHPDIAAVREALRRAIASAQHVTQHFTLLDTAWLFAAQNSLSRLEAKLSAPAVSVEDAGREALREIKRQYETASNHGADAIDVIYDIVRKALQDG